ncbi:hypothetical protein K457DRAFT_702390 [Linnemannia elongata AG-77]|uniref:Uncharacterized protein n=1 Tax=Linnemannia elongata AG-77 TaxID=1314771 RepID=A0A197JNY5_9FUNG|nr:hypothetical protein K457DRAFT_702390 [Linnemannia elongata AG-77]
MLTVCNTNPSQTEPNKQTACNDIIFVIHPIEPLSLSLFVLIILGLLIKLTSKNKGAYFFSPPSRLPFNPGFAHCPYSIPSRFTFALPPPQHLKKKEKNLLWRPTPATQTLPCHSITSRVRSI